MNRIVCPPGVRVYFVGGRVVPVRVGGALFARKESNCIQIQNNTAEEVDVRIYEVSSDGSTYVYEQLEERFSASMIAQGQGYFKRPEFKRFGDRELVVTFPTGRFMRRTISGGLSGIREAPNSFFIGPRKIEARSIDFSAVPAAQKACAK